ncbi:hypothetical protein Q4603_16330 [Zobellia galactanivorans]|uniref:hypothetical protein n=1 Tax=Zobellia galactanivorans (strain DSM 12802 / CCUG 47099 / CIP 106680 / NCIMB 13871 / Dsij) TaxID=63186 RepID=UPI001C07ADD8|nr:hypothetical protein [Zobellia galactanivorans]MBU3026930.1 hypothetical protein [Zobellia galactanivorans]MDO6810194.1 hypothetical protein [Zobellia galactanivorans]
MRNHHYNRIILVITLMSFLAVGCDNHPINELTEDLADEFEAVDTGKENEKEEEEEEEEVKEIIGTMTAKVNESNFATPDFLELTGAGVSINKGYYFLQISGFDVELGLKKAQYILLSIFGKDFNSVKSGSEWNTIVEDVLVGGALAAYSENIDTDDNDNTSSTLDVLEKVYIKITSIDHEKQLLSGEFSFSGKNKDTGKTYVVTDGTFKNYKYTITNN